MKIKETISLILILFLGLWTLGCEDEEKVSPEILSISPTNGSTSVAKTTEIKIEFSESMDKMSCESRFALIMGDLDDIPDDLSDGMHGTFDWDTNESIMTFHPDSTLMDSVMYSICLKEGMEMHERSSGMMMTDMSSLGSSVTGGVISKFETEK